MNGLPSIIRSKPPPQASGGICLLMKPISPNCAACGAERGYSLWPLSAELRYLHNVFALELCVGSGHRVPDVEQRARRQLPHLAAPRDHPRQYTWVPVQALGKGLSVSSFFGYLCEAAAKFGWVNPS